MDRIPPAHQRPCSASSASPERVGAAHGTPCAMPPPLGCRGSSRVSQGGRRADVPRPRAHGQPHREQRAHARPSFRRGHAQNEYRLLDLTFLQLRLLAKHALHAKSLNQRINDTGLHRDSTLGRKLHVFVDAYVLSVQGAPQGPREVGVLVIGLKSCRRHNVRDLQSSQQLAPVPTPACPRANSSLLSIPLTARMYPETSKT